MSSEDMSEYEAMRLAKIARNEARLRALGLHENPWSDAAKIQSSNTLNPSTRTATRLAPTGPLRRSKRLKESPGNGIAATTTRGTKNPRRNEGEQDTQEDPVYHPFEDGERGSRKLSPSSNGSLKTVQKSVPMVSLPLNSARSMALNLDKLLTDSLVGKTLTANGKAHVMEESAKLAVAGYSGAPISFNKYSGVQEWGNDVLFLWINLDAPVSDVTNDFPNGGRRVTWFGGSRMHEGSNAIQRLLSVARDPTTTGGIVLWCRRYLKERRTFEPYTCLGRLSYVSHEPESHPLAFVWKLEDFERITTHKDKERRETFSAMVAGRASGTSTSEAKP